MARRFPFLFGRNLDPADASEAIERRRRLRVRREVLGVHVDSRSGVVTGSIVATIGSGRWSRFDAGPTLRLEIPAALCRGVERLRQEPEPALNEVQGISADFARWLAPLLSDLDRRRGASDDPPLAVCVHDDGWRITDFDGAERFVEMVDPVVLAERGGLSVISDLRAADVAAGGSGEPLEPLAAWFLLADRSDRVSSSVRVLLRTDRPAAALFLPPSDGLDAEHPLIERWSLETWNEAIESIERDFPGNPTPAQLDRWAVQGRVRGELLEWFHRREKMARSTSSRSDRSSSLRVKSSGLGFVGQSPKSESAAEDSLLAVAGNAGATTADVCRTAYAWRASQLRPHLERKRVDLIWLAGPGAASGLLRQELERTGDGLRTVVLDETPWRSETIAASLAGVLGFLHIDQQPASLPWITGADLPRLHGRLVPGHPTAWRRLLVEMADFRPPPMKLREAV